MQKRSSAEARRAEAGVRHVDVMKRKCFALERAPLFTAIFSDNTVATLAQQARTAHWAGADAVCVELRNLPREERTPERLRVLMDATPLPTMCCLYRTDILPSLTV